MSYDPASTAPIDVIRRAASDTSNDPSTELMLDAEYAAEFGRFGVDVSPGTPTDTGVFYRAAAHLYRVLAKRAADRPTSVSNPEDGSISWPDRVGPLTTLARQADADADKAEAAASENWWGPTVTVRSSFLTGSEATGW